MRKLSEVQTTLTRLRKKYRNAIERGNKDDVKRLSIMIHALEWMVEIQPTVSDNGTD